MVPKREAAVKNRNMQYTCSVLQSQYDHAKSLIGGGIPSLHLIAHIYLLHYRFVRHIIHSSNKKNGITISDRCKCCQHVIKADELKSILDQSFSSRKCGALTFLTYCLGRSCAQHSFQKSVRKYRRACRELTFSAIPLDV